MNVCRFMHVVHTSKRKMIFKSFSLAYVYLFFISADVFQQRKQERYGYLHKQGGWVLEVWSVACQLEVWSICSVSAASVVCSVSAFYYSYSSAGATCSHLILLPDNDGAWAITGTSSSLNTLWHRLLRTEWKCNILLETITFINIHYL